MGFVDFCEPRTCAVKHCAFRPNLIKQKQVIVRVFGSSEYFSEYMNGHAISATYVFNMRVDKKVMFRVASAAATLVNIVAYLIIRAELANA